MSFLLRSICLMLIVALPAGGAAADTPEKGPNAGMAIPHDLSARDQSGQQRNFKSLARERGLVVLFSRSLSW